MKRYATIKKGSSQHEAIFLHANRFHILEMRSGLNKGIVVEIGEKKKGLDFDILVNIAKAADQLQFHQIDGDPIGRVICDSSEMFKYLEDNFQNFFAATGVYLGTKSLDEIRAIAKELRADKSVAKAAKVPAKPKASLRDRRDVI